MSDTRFNHFRKSQNIACAALLLAGLTLIGCDRENSANPQGTEASDAQSAAPMRYSIDRSHRGSAIPTTRVIDGEGQDAALSDLIGQPLVLNLWATWCGPCVEELPTLNQLATATSGTANIVTLSQDIGDDGTGPRQFLTQHGWTHLASWHDPDNAIGLVYGGGLPTTILFGSDGREVARVIGPMDWTGTAAKALLAEAGINQ